MTNDARHDEFTCFVARAEPRLRRALVAAYGPERGREAVAEALAYAWEHWADLRAMRNSLGYLYRVGQSKTRPRKVGIVHASSGRDEPWTEPGLPRALSGLSRRQRVAVVLVHGFGWTLSEVGDLLGVRVTTVQNHLDRGLKHLRSEIGVVSDD
jgi:DNA-directed RNA polymerase specialized sigma24 family protein